MNSNSVLCCLRVGCAEGKRPKINYKTNRIYASFANITIVVAGDNFMRKVLMAANIHQTASLRGRSSITMSSLENRCDRMVFLSYFVGDFFDEHLLSS